MPRYFFDIEERADERGTDLPDREAARQHAIDIAETALQEQDGERQSTITIRDENGDVTDVIRSVAE